MHPLIRVIPSTVPAEMTAEDPPVEYDLESGLLTPLLEPRIFVANRGTEDVSYTIRQVMEFEELSGTDPQMSGVHTVTLVTGVIPAGGATEAYHLPVAAIGQPNNYPKITHWVGFHAIDALDPIILHAMLSGNQYIALRQPSDTVQIVR